MVTEALHGAVGTSVLGAYERGERTISVSRLHALAHLYQCDVTQLVGCAGEDSQLAEPQQHEPLTLDLTVLREVAPHTPLARWCEMILAERAGPAPGIVQLCRSDHAAVAAMLGTSLQGLRAALQDLQAVFDRKHRRIG